MAALPYMQLYIADYLADTMHLSTEEHGAYLLLMFNYWQTGRAIPKSRLPKIARLSNDRWISVESSLKEFFSDNGIRCEDYAVVARFSSFPDGGRALLYRRGDEVSFVPLQPNEIIGTPTLFTEMLEKAGYRITSCFDTLHS